jgi:hypothetical protein
MSNYTETTNFTALTTAEAIINGAAFDLEYGNIATAIATKFDNLTAGYTGPFTMNTSGSSVTLTITGTAGTSALQVTGSGVQLGAPTGGDQGTGTLNVSGGYYVNGSLVSGSFTPVLKQKSATTNRASTTTLTNDPDLTYAITATGTYRVQVFAGWSTNGGAQGINANLNYSGAISNGIANYEIYSVTGADSTSVASLTYPLATTVTGQGLTSGNADNGGIFTPYVIDSVFQATNVGTVAFAWAQFTSSATNLSVTAGSYMIVTRLA